MRVTMNGIEKLVSANLTRANNFLPLIQIKPLSEQYGQLFQFVIVLFFYVKDSVTNLFPLVQRRHATGFGNHYIVG